MTIPRIVFAGTPDFSVPCLNRLLTADIELVGVFTQPDRVAGRGKKLQQSPVKQYAIKSNIEVYQPASFKKAAARQDLADLKPDLIVVVAYGLILPQSVLDIPRLGCVNVHASLLPRWRGAAPIQRAIEAGDKQTGACLMRMDKGLDTGPILACRQRDIAAEETGGMLHDALSSLGAELLGDKLNDILASRIKAVPQATSGANYAHKLSKDESQIDWHLDAIQLANKIRAFNPWPIVTCKVNKQLIRIHRAIALPAQVKPNAQAGEILGVSADGIEVQTGNGSLNITELQKPGGKKLSARDFLNGFALMPGQQV